MTKAELKLVLCNYALIHDAIEAKDEQIIIKRYRRELQLKVVQWVTDVKYCINLLLTSENEIVRQIIELSYMKGYKDREIMMRMPLSSSGYYRVKKYIEEKIYELCILHGYVTEDEILNNKIQ